MPMLLFDTYVLALIIPLILLLDTHGCLVSRFGFTNTVANIEASPETFVKQCAPMIVYRGWISVGVVAVIAVINVINWMLQCKRKRTVCLSCRGPEVLDKQTNGEENAGE
jgi:hypothetical protein